MNNLEKWRLILGKFSKQNLEVNLSQDNLAVERLLDSVYDNEYSNEKGMYGSESSGVMVIKNLKEVQKILHQDIVNKIATDAFETYGMYEVLADDNYLENAKADMDLLKKLIMYKDYTKEEERNKIKYKIRQIANEIKKELLFEIDLSRIGTINKSNSSRYNRSKALDMKKTIEKSMKNYNKEEGKLYVEDVYFYPNKAKNKPADIVLVVDCSGSMVESLIYIAIVSSIFYNISNIDIKIVLFDTRIVDLSDVKEDPINILLDVQLGGGTDVARGLAYSRNLIKRPDKTLFIVITDLFSEETSMLKEFEEVKNTGARTLVLTGIQNDSNSYYNSNFAKKLGKIGIPVEGVTVKELANYIKGAGR
ncbi:MAG: VWA domain-containing protein [Marinisporobacter sp.]|jgi:hypothetical protein|nr:VWA domain-containing protein [Marinisporobacter sp.]